MQKDPYFHPFCFLSTSFIFSQIPMTSSQQRSSENSEKVTTQQALPKSLHIYKHNKKQQSKPVQRPNLRMSLLSMSSKMISTDNSPGCFNAPLPSPADISSVAPKPHPYQPHLCPLPLPYHPHCLAKDRLHLWSPESSTKQPVSGDPPTAISEKALDHILKVMGASWAESFRIASSDQVQRQ